MTEQDLRQLYIDELKDLYSAENQLVKALPKMAKASMSDELRQAFEEHLEETKGHVERLENIFDALEENPKGKKCAGMEGLVKEGSENISEYEDEVRDAAIIGAAQRVEHYEIAAYGTVIAFAELLGENEHVSQLKETLEEEKAADSKLTEISKEVNVAAQEPDSEEEPESKPTKRKSGRAA
jgi:ferritin-like metal-binding protein YciE